MRLTGLTWNRHPAPAGQNQDGVSDEPCRACRRRTLKELSGTRQVLNKASSRLRLEWLPIGPPLTTAQRSALAVTAAAVADAKAAIDRATGALDDALRTNDQSGP
jgi:hypothetical protein